MTLQVLVIGSGQRVRRAALPALLSRSDSFTIQGVYSRKPKQVFAEDTQGKQASDAIEVTALSELNAAHVAACNLIYICVSKGAVPKVLANLAELAGSTKPNLLIDTPVLLFKHMAAAKHFAAFGQVWVAEDMSTLPWLDSLLAAQAQVGAPKHLLLDRSAFAYHGVALAKTLLASQSLTSSRRKRTGPKTHERQLRFSGGLACQINEPRDYATGGFRLTCASGTITDPGSEAPQSGDLVIATRIENERCSGFEVLKNGQPVEAYASQLADHEVELLGHFSNDQNGSGPIQHMDAMKRVGFARLLDRIAAGQSLWTLEDGLDDMWIDYLTEKAGRWRKTPLTSARSGFARNIVGLTMSAALKVKG